jgi:peptidoglycan hydrolase-like protein with peptidoglycan-binding domain
MVHRVVGLAVVGALLLGGCSSSDDTATTMGGSGAAPPSSAPGPSTPSAPTAPSTAPTTAPPTTVPPTTVPPTTVPPTTVPPTTTTVPPETLTEPPGPLQPGSVGVRTRALQQALRDQAYDPGEPDGRFGTKTVQAVWAFQALFRLPRDGVVTPEIEALILARPAPTMLRPDLGPTHTEIDLTGQVLQAWRDGALVLVTHVSSGSEVPYCERTRDGRRCGSAVTPLGVFQFGRRVAGWRDAPLGRLYNPVYFNGGIAVHGAGSVPNHPASHGCVRIPMHVAEYFPSLVNTGDPVEVFRS